MAFSTHILFLFVAASEGVSLQQLAHTPVRCLVHTHAAEMLVQMQRSEHGESESDGTLHGEAGSDEPAHHWLPPFTGSISMVQGALSSCRERGIL